MVRESREDKVERILTSTLSELAKKGYESTTINDIADSAKISRGLLHYYFKDKEDLVAQALSFGFGTMWDASIASISSARTPEQLVDAMIDVLKKNLKEKPDFSALLFEMWVSSRRSRKINKVFADGLNEAISRLKKLFEFASAMGIVKLNQGEAEGFVRMLLAVYHGMAIQLLSSPERIDDDRIWLPIRRMLLLALQ